MRKAFNDEDIWVCFHTFGHLSGEVAKRLSASHFSHYQSRTHHSWSTLKSLISFTSATPNAPSGTVITHCAEYKDPLGKVRSRGHLVYGPGSFIFVLTTGEKIQLLSIDVKQDVLMNFKATKFNANTFLQGFPQFCIVAKVFYGKNKHWYIE